MSFKFYDKMLCDCYTTKAKKGPPTSDFCSSDFRLPTSDFRSNKRRR